MSELSFSTLKLPTDLLTNLATLGYQIMTPIQAQSLPPILAGKDVIAQGKTGSGKTAAFGLGLLAKLEVKRFRIQTLVMCPTRELADQVAQEIRRLARGIHNIKVLTLCGGTPLGPQIGSLEHGAHIIVGTPGRIEEHLRKGTLKLEHVNTLILDEADRMLDMGFQDSLDNIIEQMPTQRQTLLFSATFPKKIVSISQRIMHNPVMTKVESTHDDVSIKQHFYKVTGNETRLEAIRLLLLEYRPESTVIFCNTKLETQTLANELSHFGFGVLKLHGDLEQKDRDRTLIQFSNKSASVLVATDVAARGLDIDTLDMVINYHLAHDPEIHVHRIGRTGRAGSKGIACSLISNKEHYKVSVLEKYLDKAIVTESLPGINVLDKPLFFPEMITLLIDGGKKQKLRAGDILGALTADKTVTSNQVGKINLTDIRSYVAVNREIANIALKKLSVGKMKGRSFRVRVMND